MGVPVGGGADRAEQVVTGAMVGTGNGDGVQIKGPFNVSLWGTFSATLVPEKSFDGGSTWIPVTFSDGTAMIFTTPMSITWNEPEAGVIFRLYCSEFVSGTVNWRISR